MKTVDSHGDAFPRLVLSQNTNVYVYIYCFTAKSIDIFKLAWYDCNLSILDFKSTTEISQVPWPGKAGIQGDWLAFFYLTLVLCPMTGNYFALSYLLWAKNFKLHFWTNANYLVALLTILHEAICCFVVQRCRFYYAYHPADDILTVFYGKSCLRCKYLASWFYNTQCFWLVPMFRCVFMLEAVWDATCLVWDSNQRQRDFSPCFLYVLSVWSLLCPYVLSSFPPLWEPLV